MVAAAEAVVPSLGIIPQGTWSQHVGKLVYPSSIISLWQTMNNDPGTAQTTPKQIYTQIASGGANLIPMKMNGLGTSVQFTMEYDQTLTMTSGPIVWAVGASFDAAGNLTACWRLKDDVGGIAWTLSNDNTNDCEVTANKRIVAPVIVDATGADQVFILVVTAAVGNAFATGTGKIVGHIL